MNIERETQRKGRKRRGRPIDQSEFLMVLIGYKATEVDEGRSDIPLSPWPWARSSLVTFDPINPTADLCNPAVWTVHGEKHHSCLQMRIDFPRLGCWKCGLKYVNNVSQEQFFPRIVDAEMNWLFLWRKGPGLRCTKALEGSSWTLTAWPYWSHA